MKRRKFSEKQIIGILKEHKAGLSTANLCRQTVQRCGATSVVLKAHGVA